MIVKNSPLSEVDPDVERRRVLAKVYSLLIRLADEPGNRPILTNLVSEEVMVEMPTPAETDASMKEVNS